MSDRYAYERDWCRSLSDRQLRSEIEALKQRGCLEGAERESLRAYEDEAASRRTRAALGGAP